VKNNLTRRNTRGLRPLGCQPLRGRHPCALRYVPIKQWSVTLKYLFIFCFFITFQSYATTWGESEVEDPIEPEFKCKVQEPASSGSYIYHWPSKYDQVFWPLTAPQGIWYCKNSGFIAFIGDFEEITKEEKIKISQYLKESDQKNIDNLTSKLELLEALYSLRNKDDEFNNRIKRVFAYLYEQEGQLELANSYRKSALEEINAFLKTDLSEYKNLEYLYVCSGQLIPDSKLDRSSAFAGGTPSLN